MIDRVTDELWGRFRRHIPPHVRGPRGGRPPRDDRACLDGIVFVLRTGTQWQRLAGREFGASGSTCWRRFADWTRAGVWAAVHGGLLDELGLAGRVDQSAAVIDSASVRAVFGGATPAPTPRTARRTAASAT